MIGITKGEKSSDFSPFYLLYISMMKAFKNIRTVGFFTLSLLFLPLSSGAQVNPDKINSSLIKESVKAVLGVKQDIQWNRVIIGDETKNKLKEQFKAKSGIADTLFIGSVASGESTRYVLPDIAPSRSEKFSYLLYFDESKEIIGVDVLEYRENYGYEIDYSYFRNQFKGKSRADKIVFGRTIQNISGATISARSLTNSIHDLMLIINKIQLP